MTAVLLLSLLAQTGQVPAPPPDVTLVVMVQQPEQKKFADILARTTGATLANAGLNFVKPPSGSLSEIIFTLGCSRLSRGCLAKLGDSVGATVVIVAGFSREPAPGIVYSLVDVKSKRRTAMGAVALARYDMVGAQRVAAAIRKQLGLAPRLVLKSQPPGAAVRVDGNAVGKTPLELQSGLTEGLHQVSLRFEDGEELQQTVMVKRGEETVVQINRAPLVTQAAPASGDASMGIAPVLGWGAIAVAAVATVTGAVFSVAALSTQSRYQSDRVIDGVTVRDMSRGDAKTLVQEMEAYTIGAEISFATGLALAFAGALVFAFGGD